MSEKATAAARAEALEAEAANIRQDHGLDPRYIFPSFEGAPGGFHIEGHRTFWIGFEIMKMDYNGAKDFVQTSFFQIWNLYVEMAKQQRTREEIARAPAEPGLAGLVRKFTGRR